MNFLAAKLGVSGLSDVGYRFMTAAGTFTGSRQTGDVYEFPGLRGVYGVQSPTIPSDAVGVYWDSAGAETVYGYEFFNPRFPNVDTASSGAVLTDGTLAGQLATTDGVLNTVNTVNSVQATAEVGTLNEGAISLLSFQSGILPANLALLEIDGSGRIAEVNQVNALADNAITAASIAADAGVEIANAVDAKLAAEHGAGAWVDSGEGGGAGAYAVTVRVTDGTGALQNATVRVFEGGMSAVVQTGVDGEGQYSLDAATYTVAVTKSGYQFTPTTRTVTGNEEGTLTEDLEMTQVVTVTPPDDPAKCRVYGYVYDKTGRAVRHAEVSATLSRTPAAAGGILLAASVKALSDATGYVELELYLTGGISPAGTQWIIEIPAAGYSKTTELTTSTLDLGTLIT